MAAPGPLTTCKLGFWLAMALAQLGALVGFACLADVSQWVIQWEKSTVKTLVYGIGLNGDYVAYPKTS